MSNTPKGRRRSLKFVLTGLLAVMANRHASAQGAGSVTIEQPDERNHQAFIERAFAMKREAIDNGDQGYGAVVVRDDVIIGQSPSQVVLRSDPTAHAEMESIRDAARRLGSRDLEGCILYSSSPACPMCEAAAYWAGIERMVYGRSARDGGRPRLCA